MKFKKMMKLTVFSSVFIPLMLGSVIQAQAFTSYELDSDLNYEYKGAKAPEFYKNTTVAYNYKGVMPHYINQMYGTSNQDIYNSNFGSNIVGLNGYGDMNGNTYGYGYGMNYDNYISSLENSYFDNVAGGGQYYNVNLGAGGIGGTSGVGGAGGTGGTGGSISTGNTGNTSNSSAGTGSSNSNSNSNSNLIINYTDNATNTQNQISGVLPNEVGDVVFPSYFADTNYSYNSNTSSNKDVKLDKYSDGSIGTIKIKNANLEVKAFDYSDIYQSMKKGVGHLDSTAYWNGNAVFFGHNRGSTGYFNKLKNVEVGDIVEYTTKEGTRKYKIDTVKQIDQTDWSDTTYSSSNKITLITCVENKPSVRLLVQGYEVD